MASLNKIENAAYIDPNLCKYAISESLEKISTQALNNTEIAKSYGALYRAAVQVACRPLEAYEACNFIAEDEDKNSCFKISKNPIEVPIDQGNKEYNKMVSCVLKQHIIKNILNDNTHNILISNMNLAESSSASILKCIKTGLPLESFSNSVNNSIIHSVVYNPEPESSVFLEEKEEKTVVNPPQDKCRYDPFKDGFFITLDLIIGNRDSDSYSCSELKSTSWLAYSKLKAYTQKLMHALWSGRSDLSKSLDFIKFENVSNGITHTNISDKFQVVLSNVSMSPKIAVDDLAVVGQYPTMSGLLE